MSLSHSSLFDGVVKVIILIRCYSSTYIIERSVRIPVKIFSNIFIAKIGDDKVERTIREVVYSFRKVWVVHINELPCYWVVSKLWIRCLFKCFSEDCVVCCIYISCKFISKTWYILYKTRCRWSNCRCCVELDSVYAYIIRCCVSSVSDRLEGVGFRTTFFKIIQLAREWIIFKHL